MKKSERRNILKAGVGLASAPILAGLAGCSSEEQAQESPAVVEAVVQAPTRLAMQTIRENVSVINGAPGNILVLTTDSGHMLVDSGSASLAPSQQLTLADASPALFNTHYHADQSGGNALFGEAGATIHAHEITRQWLSADHYVPFEDYWVSAPAGDWPPNSYIREKESLTVGSENLEFGYLLEAVHGVMLMYICRTPMSLPLVM